MLSFMAAASELERVHSVLVVGAGQMGQGIAQVAASAGYRVSLSDANLSLAERSKAAILQRANKAVTSGRLDAAELGKLTDGIVCQQLEQAAPSADLVIEAVSEDPELKLDLFRKLDQLTPPAALLCSNTSAISITKLAAATRRGEQVIGMHFMNPVPVMRLVELVRGLITSDRTHALATAFAEQLGKTVVTSRDRPGFIVNRVLIPFLNEACFALEEGVASVQDVDQAVSLGLNHKLGPLRLADLIGLDTVLAIANVLLRDFGDDKYRPSVLLKNLVAAGHLGVKTGRGFYVYEGNTPKQVNPSL